MRSYRGRIYRDSMVRAHRACKFYKDTSKFYRDSMRFYRDYSSIEEAASLTAKMANKAAALTTGGQAVKMEKIAEAAEAVSAGRGGLGALIQRIRDGFRAIPSVLKSFFQKIVGVFKNLWQKLRANPAVQQESGDEMVRLLKKLEGSSSSAELNSLIKKLTTKPPKSMKELSAEITGAKVSKNEKDELRRLLNQLEKKKARSDLPFANMSGGYEGDINFNVV